MEAGVSRGSECRMVLELTIPDAFRGRFVRLNLAWGCRERGLAHIIEVRGSQESRPCRTGARFVTIRSIAIRHSKLDQPSSIPATGTAARTLIVATPMRQRPGAFLPDQLPLGPVPTNA
jgi:hypothetical protein